MKRFSISGFGGVAALVGLMACGGGSSSQQTTPAAAADDSPIAATADAAKGAEVFATYCNGCHPGGQSGNGPALKGHHESLGGARNVIRNGKSTMPAFGAELISDDDVENVLAYLQNEFGMFAAVEAEAATETEAAPAE